MLYYQSSFVYFHPLTLNTSGSVQTLHSLVSEIPLVVPNNKIAQSGAANEDISTNPIWKDSTDHSILLDWPYLAVSPLILYHLVLLSLSLRFLICIP